MLDSSIYKLLWQHYCTLLFLILLTFSIILLQLDNGQACLHVIKSSKDLCKDALSETQQVCSHTDAIFYDRAEYVIQNHSEISSRL